MLRAISVRIDGIVLSSGVSQARIVSLPLTPFISLSLTHSLRPQPNRQAGSQGNASSHPGTVVPAYRGKRESRRESHLDKARSDPLHLHQRAAPVGRQDNKINITLLSSPPSRFAQGRKAAAAAAAATAKTVHRNTHKYTHNTADPRTHRPGPTHPPDQPLLKAVVHSRLMKALPCQH